MYFLGYKDSKPVADFDPKVPTILGLPGIMGTHEELDGLLMPLAKLGFRVIIPNLPGKGKTGCDVTKPVFGFLIKTRLKPVPSATETS